MFAFSIFNSQLISRVKMTCFNRQFRKQWGGKAFPSLQLVNDLPLPLLTRGQPLVTRPVVFILSIMSLPVLGLVQDQTQFMSQLDGPVQARVIRVLDGDTIEVRAFTWPDETKLVRIRIADIQAAEDSHRAQCAAERKAGSRATHYLQKRLPEGTPISLFDVRPGKYARRMVARVVDSNGRDLAADLLQLGHALSWPKNAPKPSFCKNQ